MARERIIVYEPSENEAGLAVSWNPNPGPHETKFTVDQLWPPHGDDDRGRAEPVYVGDRMQAASLIEALGGALQMDLEVERNA